MVGEAIAVWLSGAAAKFDETVFDCGNALFFGGPVESVPKGIVAENVASGTDEILVLGIEGVYNGEGGNRQRGSAEEQNVFRGDEPFDLTEMMNEDFDGVVFQKDLGEIRRECLPADRLENLELRDVVFFD